jgi:hypothetical protein
MSDAIQTDLILCPSSPPSFQESFFSALGGIGAERRTEVLRLAPAQAVTQTFSAALEDTSPHEPAYHQRSCVIAVGMETAPCCEVLTRASGYGIRL